jgi:putative ABC transport system ATP-binding protein
MKETELVKLRRDNIGFVFQQFYLMPTLTARENIELPLLFSKKDGNKSRIDDVLEMVGLADRGDHLPGQLSGGEMQRVAIGRALINDPKIILADEPTGNLDLTTGEEVIALLKRMSHERRVTVIAATHDFKMLNVSDRVVWIRDGRVDKIENREELSISIGRIGVRD